MLKYIELKSEQGDSGPAWIGHVKMSRTGQTIYFNDRCLMRITGGGISGNYYDIETHDEYWVSGVKKQGSNRHPCGGGMVMVEDEALDDLLKLKGRKTLDPSYYKIVQVKKTDVQRFTRMLNEKIVQSD